jgi:hypothetical protein
MQRAGDSRALLSDMVFYCGRAALAVDNIDSETYNNRRRSSAKETACPAEYYQQQKEQEKSKKRLTNEAKTTIYL